MKYTFANLTEHTINYRLKGYDLIIPKSGVVARVVENPVRTEVLETLDCNGQPVFIAVNVVVPEVVDLPAPKDGVIYVASAAVAVHAKRPDVIAPDTFRAGIRNKLTKQVEAVTLFRLFDLGK